MDIDVARSGPDFESGKLVIYDVSIAFNLEW